MDPNACLERFLTALEDADASEAWHAHLDLSVWLNRGGFEPSDQEGLKTFREFKRLDKYTSVGSYPLLYARLNGHEFLCACCASLEGSGPEQADVLWEGNGHDCDQCGETVESAYGSGDDDRDPDDVYESTE